MEQINGIPLFRWVTHSGKNVRLVKKLLAELLDACFRLDSIGLDHGELSRTPKNVLVTADGSPCIVDFETASMVRRVANVTSLLQYFMFGSISKSISAARLFSNRRSILRALSRYKHEGSVASYQHVLRTLKLTS
jgi:putative serine/threonine protein kinase